MSHACKEGDPTIIITCVYKSEIRWVGSIAIVRSQSDPIVQIHLTDKGASKPPETDLHTEYHTKIELSEVKKCFPCTNTTDFTNYFPAVPWWLYFHIISHPVGQHLTLFILKFRCASQSDRWTTETSGLPWETLGKGQSRQIFIPWYYSARTWSAWPMTRFPPTRSLQWSEELEDRSIVFTWSFLCEWWNNCDHGLQESSQLNNDSAYH